MLRIPAALEKGNKDRVLPIAPEFAEFLRATPEADRTGPMFNPQAKRPNAARLQPHRVGELASAIGKKAVVAVATDSRTGRIKWASAHDLRRSFGERWAYRDGITPQVLQQLMRHENIETSMRYYVGRNAEATAGVLWAALEGRSGTLSGTTASVEDNNAAERVDVRDEAAQNCKTLAE